MPRHASVTVPENERSTKSIELDKNMIVLNKKHSGPLIPKGPDSLLFGTRRCKTLQSLRATRARYSTAPGGDALGDIHRNFRFERSCNYKLKKSLLSSMPQLRVVP